MSGVVAIAAGVNHTCALVSDGTVQCWGSDVQGELGAPAPTMLCNSGHTAFGCAPAPIAVLGLSGVTAIAGGNAHTCAILSDGSVECWGTNADGELGLGSVSGPEACGGQACSTKPVAVPGVTGATSIAIGYGHSCALLSNGTVDCWGDNTFGGLGDGSSSGPEVCASGPCSPTPAPVSGLGGVTAIASRDFGACALLSDAGVECWGSNAYGELGAGANSGPEQCSSPGIPPSACSTKPALSLGVRGVTAIAAGGANGCALLAGGKVMCWGDNESGELGDGQVGGTPSCGGERCSGAPVVVSGLGGAASLAVGGTHACALLSDSTVECWGADVWGELGAGPGAATQTCLLGACSTVPVAVPF